MQFLKTLFWVLLAVIIVLFATRNWFDVTLNLWGDIQVDIKAPVLMAVMFLLGFLPIFLLHRARLWTLRRRIDAQETPPARSGDAAAVPAREDRVQEDSPVI